MALGKGDWSGETSGETHWVWRDYGQDRAGGVVKVERLRWTLDSRLARAGKEAVQERMRLFLLNRIDVNYLEMALRR